MFQNRLDHREDRCKSGSLNQEELIWSELGGLPLLGYIIEKREGRAFTWKPLVDKSGDKLLAKTQPKFEVDGIQPNKEYFFRISAVNKEGQGPPLSADDSFIIKVHLAPPFCVQAKRTNNEESIITVLWDAPKLKSGDKEPTGFMIERLDIDSRSASWEAVDFLQGPLKDKYTLETRAPKASAAYKYRVKAVYPDGDSEWVMSDVVLASEPTRPASSSADRARERIPAVATPTIKTWKAEEEPYTSRAYELEWKPLDTGSDRVKGYLVEKWDKKKDSWKPLLSVPQGAPTQVSVPVLDTSKLRILTLGDTERSIPTEFTLPDTRRPGSRAADLVSLPTIEGWQRPQSSFIYDDDFDERPIKRTGAGTSMVEDFIVQKRQAREQMASRNKRLKIADHGASGLTLDWSDSPASLDAHTFSIEQWDPRTRTWKSIAEVPASQRSHNIRSPDSADLSFYRIVPLDDRKVPCGAAIQMDRGIVPSRRSGPATVPSSVWGVEISHVKGYLEEAGSIDIAWMPPANDGGSELLGYRLLVHDADTGEEKLIEVAPMYTSFRIEPLPLYHTYRVTVTAFNRIGESLPVTSTAPRNPGAPGMPLPPSPPSDVRATVIGSPDSDEIYCSLSWQPPDPRRGGGPVEFFLVEKWDSRSKQWIPFKKVGAGVSSLDIPHLIDDVNYAFRVRSMNEAGMSEPVPVKDYIRPREARERAQLMSPKSNVEQWITGGLPYPITGPVEVQRAQESKSRLDHAIDNAIKCIDFVWEPPKRDLKRYADRSEPKSYLMESRRIGQKKWAVLGRQPIEKGSRWRITDDSYVTQEGLFAGMPLPMSPMLRLDAVREGIDTTSDLQMLDMLRARDVPFSPTLPHRVPGPLSNYEFRISTENEYGLSEPIYLPRLAPIESASMQRKPKSFADTSIVPETHYEYETIPDFTLPREPVRPRGPLRLQTGPLISSKTSLDIEPYQDLKLSWVPPVDSRHLSGYEVLYRPPHQTKWHSLGTTDVVDTSFPLPKHILTHSPDVLHLGVRSIGPSSALPTPYTPLVSGLTEEALVIPKLPYMKPLQNQRMTPTFRPAGEDSLSLYTPRKVQASMVEGPGVEGADVHLSWSLPEAKLPKHPVEGYVVYKRLAGEEEWREHRRLPGDVHMSQTYLSGLPRDRDLYLAMAPVSGSRIGPITSTLDPIRLPPHRFGDITTPESYFTTIKKTPLTVKPVSISSAEVLWDRPIKAAPKMFKEFTLEYRRPRDFKWTPIDTRGPTEDQKPFNFKGLKPGERFDIRVIGSLAERPTTWIPLSDELHHVFIPPYGKLLPVFSSFHP
ncbi:hypothetical protein Ciccas_000129 [Cichlidogyrus casuarinus]|uniref:Fibronectin type-III domain-containing protein n=1 Tax=Cichlidogyrus casuarinus TaxID=1844966 RepID=A0ABD2QPV3_9PLAT